MLSLNTHLPIEVVKQNKKLKEELYDKKRSSIILKHTNYYPEDFNLTISDIIDNAEELFKRTNGGQKRQWADDRLYAWDISRFIIDKCFNDKPIQEISSYIVENIK